MTPWTPTPWPQAPTWTLATAWSPSPPVIDATPKARTEQKTLSASELEEFSTCRRKWWFKRGEGFVETVGAMALGTRVHKILEDYLTDGTLPDMEERMVLPEAHGKRNPDGSPVLVIYWPGQIAYSGFHLLPPPGVVTVEGSFTCTTPASKWRGVKDGVYHLLDGQPARLPDPSTPLVDRPHVVVMDHKTTSGKRSKSRTTGQLEAKWAHTPETLLTNVQAVLYAHSEMERWGVDEVTARWVYYLTSGDKRDAWAVEALFTRDHTQKAVAALDTMATEVHRLYSILPKNVRGVALTLDPSPNACEKFGGCPHKDTCNLTASQRIMGMMSNDIDSILKRALETKANLAGGIVPPLGNPPPLTQPFNQGPPPVQLDEITKAALRQAVQGGATDAQIQTYYPNGMAYVAELRAAQAPAQPNWAPQPQAAPVQAPTQAPALQAAPAQAPQLAPVLVRPWAPGDPLNNVQEYIRSRPGGAPWSVIAAAADVPPAKEVGAAYDTGYAPDGARLAAPVSTFINPPEAPSLAPQNPGQMPPPPPVNQGYQAPPDDLDAMDRDRLKALGISMGIFNASDRRQPPALKEAIRAARTGAPQPVNVQPPEVQAAPAWTPPAAQAPALAPVLAPALGSKPKPISTLFINCSPLVPEGEHMTLEEVLAHIYPKFKEVTQAGDFRLVDYGKGGGHLATFVEAFLEDEATRYPQGAFSLTVDTRTPEGLAVVSTLSRMATHIVRGF